MEVNDLGEMTITVRLSRPLRVHVWVAAKLIRLASRVLRVGYREVG